MNKLTDLVKTHQQKIVLVIGYVLVAGMAFGVGRITTPKISSPEIKAPETFSLPDNYTPKVAGIQSANPAPTTTTCNGKIKGTSSFIYHLPGGAFYDRVTKPIKCFDSETQAIAAGFKKSSR